MPAIGKSGSGKREAASGNCMRGVFAAFALAACFLPLSPSLGVAASRFPLATSRAGAQAAPVTGDTMAFYKALDLEAAGKFRDAAPLFRTALHSPAAVNALLGLERVYAELGWTDSLV